MATDVKNQTDRTLLLNELANVNGATEVKPFSKSLQLRNLEFIFDESEKLIRLRIHEPKGVARTLHVRAGNKDEWIVCR